jgi:hypothetical protein
MSIEIPKITGSTICPFLNVSEYLAIRPKSTATKPLFCHYNGTILTRQQFSALRLSRIKFVPLGRFQILACSHARLMIEDPKIQTELFPEIFDEI